MIKIQQSSAQVNPCKDVFQLASSVYKVSNALPAEILESWWQKHPAMFHLALHNGKLYGYTSAFPLTEEAFKKTLVPDFDEKTLEPDSILKLDTPGNYQMYFCSIVVHPNWQGLGLSKSMRKSFLSYLLSLWHQGKHVKNLSASVVSEKGADMMKSLGMNAISNGQHGDVFQASHTEQSLQNCLDKLS